LSLFMMPASLARRASTLPGPRELDEMVSMHAVQSFTIPVADAETQQVALADATARLHAEGALAQ
jgi:hypothetical protein